MSDRPVSSAPLWIPLAGGAALIAVSAAGINMANAVRDSTTGKFKCPDRDITDQMKLNRTFAIVGLVVAVAVTLYGLSPLLRRGVNEGRARYREIRDSGRRGAEPNTATSQQ